MTKLYTVVLTTDAWEETMEPLSISFNCATADDASLILAAKLAIAKDLYADGVDADSQFAMTVEEEAARDQGLLNELQNDAFNFNILGIFAGRTKVPGFKFCGESLL